MAPLRTLAVALALSAASCAAQGAEEALPPVVTFVGKRPKMKIVPGGDPNGTQSWFMLTFGMIAEVDARGRRVRGRTIRSLAEHKAMTWDQEEGAVNGVPATITTMELPLKDADEFRPCGGSPLKGLESSGSVIVKVYVFNSTAEVQYGNETVEVARNQMKFNIESTGWPFCGDDHTLEVRVAVASRSDDGHKRFGHWRDMAGRSADEGQKRRWAVRRRMKAKGFRGSAGKKDMQVDLPSIAIVDGNITECDVDMMEILKSTVIRFRFPAFSERLVYDPTAGAVESTEDAPIDEETAVKADEEEDTVMADPIYPEDTNSTGAAGGSSDGLIDGAAPRSSWLAGAALLALAIFGSQR